MCSSHCYMCWLKWQTHREMRLTSCDDPCEFSTRSRRVKNFIILRLSLIRHLWVCRRERTEDAFVCTPTSHRRNIPSHLFLLSCPLRSPFLLGNFKFESLYPNITSLWIKVLCLPVIDFYFRLSVQGRSSINRSTVEFLVQFHHRVSFSNDRRSRGFVRVIPIRKWVA